MSLLSAVNTALFHSSTAFWAFAPFNGVLRKIVKNVPRKSRNRGNTRTGSLFKDFTKRLQEKDCLAGARLTRIATGQPQPPPHVFPLHSQRGSRRSAR